MEERSENNLPDPALSAEAPAETEERIPQETPVPAAPAEEPEPSGEEDFARQAEEDLSAIRGERPDCRVDHLAELPFALRFAELRELGLSVREALAAAEVADGGKSHLRPVRPRTSGGERPAGITHGEMALARDLFGDGVSDSEIRDLYRRVTR